MNCTFTSSSSSFSLTRRRGLSIAGASALVACSKSDPQARLDAAVDALQAAIEARDTGDVMDLLDDNFRGSANLDPQEARRMLTGVFLRYKNIRVVAVGRRSQVDPVTPTLGRVEAQVLVTGAQGLIPERVEPYGVKMEWRLVDGDWKLSDLRWE